MSDDLKRIQRDLDASMGVPARILMTETRTFRSRTADHCALLLELWQRGPGEDAELARRLGWTRDRVQGAARDAVCEVKKTDYGWVLTSEGKAALEVGL